jgi:hypothetical protein
MTDPLLAIARLRVAVGQQLTSIFPGLMLFVDYIFKQITMLTIETALSELAVPATLDDITFPMVLSTLRELDELPPGHDDTERMLHFVGLMLDKGFIPVSSPYSDPPSAPWTEQGKAAVLQRLRQEWEALDHDVTFLDLCWFHKA